MGPTGNQEHTMEHTREHTPGGTYEAAKQVKKFALWCGQQCSARSGIRAYQSPIQVMRFTTQLHFADLENLAPEFLSRLSQCPCLGQTGWSIGSAALMGNSNNLSLELLAGTAPAELGRGQNSARPSLEKGQGLLDTLETYEAGLTGMLDHMSLMLASANTSNIGRGPMFRRRSTFLENAPPWLPSDAAGPSPSQVMALLQNAGLGATPVGTQVLLQSGPHVHLLELHQDAAAASAASVAPAAMPHSSQPGTSPSTGGGLQCGSPWSQRELTSDDPIPGLMNLGTQPQLTSVTPRCVASDGRTPLVLKVKGMYLQGGTLLARHAGRYLSTRRMAEGRIQTGTGASASIGSRARPLAGAPLRDALRTAAALASSEDNEVSYLEILIEDPPTCGPITVECKQGLLLSNPLHVAVVPVGGAVARELAPMTAQLNRPLHHVHRVNRSRTQLQPQAGAAATAGAVGAAQPKDVTPSSPLPHGTAGRAEAASACLPSAANTQPASSPLALASSQSPEHAGAPAGARGQPGQGQTAGGAVDSRASSVSQQAPPEDPRLAEAYELVVRDLGAWIQFWKLTRSKPGPDRTASIDGAAAAVFHTDAGGVCSGASTDGPGRQVAQPGLDMTAQLHSVITSSPTYAVLMMETGLQLLALCCDLGWASTARWVLQGLLEHRQGAGPPGSPRKSLGDAFREICKCVAATGLGLMHRAVHSRSAAMVAEVVTWYTAAHVPMDWGEQGLFGLTPLHLAACAKDGGLLAIHLLRRWASDVGPLWGSVRAGPYNLTPADCCTGLGQDFLNRMAAMALDMECRTCEDLGRARANAAQQAQARQGPLPAVPAGMSSRRSVSIGGSNADAVADAEAAVAHNRNTRDAEATSSAPTSRGPSPTRAPVAVGCLGIFGFWGKSG